MKHKLSIYSVYWGGQRPRRLWYVTCLGCDWATDTTHEWPDGRVLWGRPSQDAALAVGIAHQKEQP